MTIWRKPTIYDQYGLSMYINGGLINQAFNLHLCLVKETLGDHPWWSTTIFPLRVAFLLGVYHIFRHSHISPAFQLTLGLLRSKTSWYGGFRMAGGTPSSHPWKNRMFGCSIIWLDGTIMDHPDVHQFL